MSSPNVNFWEIKEEIRVLGVDDGPFEFGEGQLALLVGTIFRGGHWLDGVMTGQIQVDGDDVTEEITRMISTSRHRGQLRVAMTDGLTFGGFNILDAEEVLERSGIPVISVTRRKPDLESMKKALGKFEDRDARWRKIEKSGKPIKHRFDKPRGKGVIYFQAFGIDEEDAHSILEITSTRSLMPEPVRVAHIIASGMVKGESYGRA
jgi:endonuclease V-like protein UPF0215 family